MNPFVGLRPFREDERHLFMGRELATAYVETKSELNPLTLLFARSGIGKSSFLTSRLIPHLREFNRPSGEKDRAGGGAVVYLNEWGGNKPEDVVQKGLGQLALMRGAPQQKYLILDQFEDVFKQDIDRREVWESFAEIANSDAADIRILVTMREEWLGAWEEVEQYVPSAFSSMVRLAPLSPKELRKALLIPIQNEGSVSITAELVPILLSDLKKQNAFGLGEGFVEPGMLQLVAHRLWDEASQSGSVIDLPLYERLGRANQIIGEFVWRHLRGDGASTVQFAPEQRVLWAGLTRHLSMAHGVKATVTPESISKKLLLQDLGLSGAAFAVGKGLNVRKFLQKPTEKRGASPPALMAWIEETLDIAHRSGFLKRQLGFREGEPGGKLFELTHDGLDDIFRTFSLEFEKWVTRRVYFFWSILFVFLLVLPYLVFVGLSDGISAALLRLVVIPFFLGIYAGFLWLLSKLITYLALVTYYPLMRWLTSGRIDPPAKQKRPAKTSKKKPGK